MKALGWPLVASGDIILDRRITVKSYDMDFVRIIHAYKEIRDRFAAL
jgi:hypothetical protein